MAQTELVGQTWLSPKHDAILTTAVVFDPSGKQLREVVMSGKYITCPTWGGKNLDTLFITSASDSSATAAKDDLGGNIFSLDLEKSGVKGVPKFEFAG